MIAEKNTPNNLSNLDVANNTDPFKVEKPVVGVNPEADAERDIAKFIQKFRDDLKTVRVA